MDEESEDSSPPEDSEEDEEDSDNNIAGIEFDLEVSKVGRPAVTFHLTGHPAQGLMIHSLHFAQPPSATAVAPGAKPEPFYEGPVMTELEPLLQQNLNDFVLGVCGIDADVTEWLIEEADRVEQKQYVAWLEGINKLVN